MNNDLILGSRPLIRGQVRRVGGGIGRRVECLSGSLWVTQDGDLRDIVIDAGSGFSFDRPGLALLSALADSRYVLCDDCARESYCSGPSSASGSGMETTSMPSSRKASASARDALPRMPRPAVSP